MAEQHHQHLGTLFNVLTVAIAGAALWLSILAYESDTADDAASASRDASKVTWYWEGSPGEQPAGIFVQNKGLTQVRDITIRFTRAGSSEAPPYLDFAVVESCTWDSFGLTKEQVTDLLGYEAFMYFRDAENRVWRVDGKHNWQRVKDDRPPKQDGTDLTTAWQLPRTSGEPSHCG